MPRVVSSTRDELAHGGARDAASACRWLALAAATLVAGCGGTDAVAPDGTVDGAAPDGRLDAPDAAPPAFEQKVVQLASGLEVTVFGSPDYLATIETGMTAQELCASSWLAVTVVREVHGGASKYAAVAHARAMARPCEDAGRDFCIPDMHVRLFLRALLSGFDLPEEPNGQGYFGHPMGITLLMLEDRVGPPWYTTVYDTRSLVPLSGFLHDSGGELLYFPDGWSSLASARAYRGDPTWARVVEKPFNCFETAAVIQDAMDGFFLRDLAACGIIYGMPFPVAPSTASYEDEAGCDGEPAYVAVTLSTAEEHLSFAAECPRPAEATIEYDCYTQSQ